MIKHIVGLGLCCAVVLAVAGCSRQQSDWQKTRETNSADAYEQFLKKYPSGEFTPQAQARVKELYEERDWQKARDADTPEAYQAFLKQYPEGKWTEEARIRVENFTLAQAPSGSGSAPAAGAQSGSPAASVVAGTTNNAVNLAPAAPKPTPRPAAADTPSTAGTAAAPPKAATKSGANAGSYGVQLGAFKSGTEAANKRWAHLQKEFPTLFDGLSFRVLPSKTSSGNLYRLQSIGLTEARARDVCRALQAKSQGCIVLSPARG